MIVAKRPDLKKKIVEKVLWLKMTPDGNVYT